MTEEEIKDLKIIDITRPKKEDAQRVYLHCETEEGPQYIIRKNIQIQNDEVRIVPFVPPQIYRRFSELSRLTFLARKENSNLKTQIRIGDSDLILLVRDKEEKEWTVTNLFRYGELPEIDFYKSWPVRKMPPITSPPKGR